MGLSYAPWMTSIGVGKPHWRLTEERPMMRVVENLQVLGSSTLNQMSSPTPTSTTVPASAMYNFGNEPPSDPFLPQPPCCYFPAEAIRVLLGYLPLESRCQAMLLARSFRDAANSTPSAWAICKGVDSKNMVDAELARIVQRSGNKLEMLAIHSEHVTFRLQDPIFRTDVMPISPLVELDLVGCKLITGRALLLNLPEQFSQTLRTLRIDGCRLQSSEFQQLKARFPNVHIDVDQCSLCPAVAARAVSCAGCFSSACSRHSCFHVRKCGSQVFCSDLITGGWCSRCCQSEDGSPPESCIVMHATSASA